MFSIIMIFQVEGQNIQGTATGFFFEHNNETFIITNRHVVEYARKGKDPKLVFNLHTNGTDLSQLKLVELPLKVDNSFVWKEDEDAEIDVVAIPVEKNLISASIINAFTEKDCPPRGIELPVGMDLLVIGFPRGFTDKKHYLPIAKNCIISTPSEIRFEDKPFFLIDGKLFPGMSGSPVVTKPATSFVINGETTFYHENQVFFLGVFSSSISKTVGKRHEPVYALEGQQIKIKGFKEVPISEELDLHTCWFNSQVINLVKE